MRCHYCDRTAAYAPESQGVKVGLCPEHLHDFMSTCAEADLPTALETMET